MTEMLLRTIIPIFKFEFENNNIEFAHKGTYDRANYNISLKYYGQVKSSLFKW